MPTFILEFKSGDGLSVDISRAEVDRHDVIYSNSIFMTMLKLSIIIKYDGFLRDLVTSNHFAGVTAVDLPRYVSLDSTAN